MPEQPYWSSPQMPYDQRRNLYLEYCAAQSVPGRTGFFSQIARLELGREAVDEDSILEGIAFVDSRQDCCDFAVAGLLRIFYKYHDSPLISRDLIARIEDCLLRFKYWWDEPAGDNHRCYWTENHQIIFHADELLAGQLFKERTFQNDAKDGAYHMEHALHLIWRWFDFRARFGFSEWLSNCYFEEDLLALVNLYDFAEDKELRRLAGVTIDLILFEMALHTYRGVMGCTHGRTYTRLIKGGRGEDASSTTKLMLGMGLYNKPAALGTIQLATSAYRCPPIIEAIAQDLDAPQLFKERHSFNMEDAEGFGLSFDSIEDGYLYWSVQDYTHEKVAALSQRIEELYNMKVETYEPRYEQMRAGQVAKFGRVVDPNLDVHALTEVHVQTYRTPHYMLSCAQDYRPGKPGYQQHIWQATLGIDAVVFTNHPGSLNEISRPNYWAGNGILPRAAQHENVLVCLHSILPNDAYLFSHAYFPRDEFDEVVEQGALDLRPQRGGLSGVVRAAPLPLAGERSGKGGGSARRCPGYGLGVRNGRPGAVGQFRTFHRGGMRGADRVWGLQVDYHSPTQGRVVFGWEGDLEVAGQKVALHNYSALRQSLLPGAFSGPETDDPARHGRIGHWIFIEGCYRQTKDLVQVMEKSLPGIIRRIISYPLQFAAPAPRGIRYPRYPGCGRADFRGNHPGNCRSKENSGRTLLSSF